jgi:hypothetical protein
MSATESTKVEAPEPQFPPPLRPPIALVGPNEPIRLYAGRVDFTQAGATFSAEAEVDLHWLPSPRVHFRIPNIPNGVHPSLDAVALRLPENTAIEHAFINGMSSSNDETGYKASCTGKQRPGESRSKMLKTSSPLRRHSRPVRATRLHKSAALSEMTESRSLQRKPSPSLTRLAGTYHLLAAGGPAHVYRTRTMSEIVWFGRCGMVSARRLTSTDFRGWTTSIPSTWKGRSRDS